MTTHMWWYLSRSSGIVAWLLLTTSVLWGMFLSTKILQAHKRAAWLLDLHRWLGGLTIAFVVVHIGALIADSNVKFTVADVLVPGMSSWRPLPVALGVLAMWGLVAVQGTSLMMKHLPRAFWRKVHLTSFLAFALGLGHSIFAGTDTTSPLMMGTLLLTALMVTFVAIYRVLTKRRPTPGSASRSANPSRRERPPVRTR